MITLRNVNQIPAQDLEIMADRYAREIIDFSPKRKNEFLVGRAIVDNALAKLGHIEPHVGIGRFGEPLFPSGVAGSISHDNDVIAVAIVPGFVGSVGIDVHWQLPLNSMIKILNRFESGGESSLSQWSDSLSLSKSLLINMLWSAKEAAKKSLPLDKQPRALSALQTCSESPLIC